MDTAPIKETLRQLEETIAAFGEGGPDPEKDPQAAEVFEKLRAEMIRMKINLERLEKNMTAPTGGGKEIGGKS
ncbi:MAG: hypothetical protein J5602_13145 [Clostridia bacterium]|nr:hypothetical protein [Clostridia bacterium]